MPAALAISIRAGTNPWSPSPWTDGGSRRTTTRTPQSANESAIASEGIRRAAGEAGSGAASSVASFPGSSSPVPDVITNGRPDPASADATPVGHVVPNVPGFVAHSGSTPMNRRHDAFLAAAKMSPEMLQAVTREILKPVVAAMIRDEIGAKKS